MFYTGSLPIEMAPSAFYPQPMILLDFPARPVAHWPPNSVLRWLSGPFLLSRWPCSPPPSVSRWVSQPSSLKRCLSWALFSCDSSRRASRTQRRIPWGPIFTRRLSTSFHILRWPICLSRNLRTWRAFFALITLRPYSSRQPVNLRVCSLKPVHSHQSSVSSHRLGQCPAE
jgi:hypothetical protein